MINYTKGRFCACTLIVATLCSNLAYSKESNTNNTNSSPTSQTTNNIVSKSISPTNSTNVPTSNNEDSLDEFIHKMLATEDVSNQENKISLVKPKLYVSYANKDEISEDNFGFTDSQGEYNTKLKKMKRMQVLAEHISDNYNVPLSKAEKIVYASFVESKKKNLEPLLVLSLIGVESTYKQHTKSHMGAVGLTQVIPVYHRKKIAKLGKEDMWSINGNIKLGTDILKEYLEISGGNIHKALQMYNGAARDRSYKYSRKIFDKMKKLRTVMSGS